jgi:hypothetical protein
MMSLHFLWNHKKVHRIYTEMGLNLCCKLKTRLLVYFLEPLLWPIVPNIKCSMGFMHDMLNNDVSFRSLNIIDDYNREFLGIIMDSSLNSKRDIRDLENLYSWSSNPGKIRVDNKLEFKVRLFRSGQRKSVSRYSSTPRVSRIKRAKRMKVQQVDPGGSTDCLLPRLDQEGVGNVASLEADQQNTERPTFRWCTSYRWTSWMNIGKV